MTDTYSFTPWLEWAHGPSFTLRSFQETIDGGQAFRWNKYPDYFEGYWAHNRCRLKFENSKVFYSAPLSLTDQILSELETYFAVTTPFPEITDALPWRNDPVLATAIKAFPGLRILRQPFTETLFGFLCSSTKQIPQIKAICQTVAETVGTSSSGNGYALPTWNMLAAAGEAPLRAAKLGYRARYIAKTAEIISNDTEWFKAIEFLPTDEARTELIKLPGVGRKIADCTLLFGSGRLDAFPIDTWVEKILTRAYRLDGWNTEKLQQFAHIHFGEAAGLAQQYLFAAARAGLIAR